MQTSALQQKVYVLIPKWGKTIWSLHCNAFPLAPMFVGTNIRRTLLLVASFGNYVVYRPIQSGLGPKVYKIIAFKVDWLSAPSRQFDTVE